MITDSQFDPRSFLIGWLLAAVIAIPMAKLDVRKWVPDDWRHQIAMQVCGYLVIGLIGLVLTVFVMKVFPNTTLGVTMLIGAIAGSILAGLCWWLFKPDAAPITPADAQLKTQAAFPDAFNQLAKKIESDPSNAIVSFDVNLLRAKGSKFSIGSCPGDTCMELEIGELRTENGKLVQDFLLSGDGFGVAKMPDTKYLFAVDNPIRLMGAALEVSLVGERTKAVVNIGVGASFEMFTKHADVRITVTDTNAEALRMKIALLPPSGFSIQTQSPTPP